MSEQLPILPIPQLDTVLQGGDCFQVNGVWYEYRGTEEGMAKGTDANDTPAIFHPDDVTRVLSSWDGRMIPPVRSGA